MGSLRFSYYFVEDVGSFRITTMDGAVTFLAHARTALTGSQLSIRAQRRAQEAIRRREEMERLHQLASVLLSARRCRRRRTTRCGSWWHLFDLQGAALRIEGETKAVSSPGDYGRRPVSVIPLNAASR